MHDLSELALTKQSPSGLIESALGEDLCPIILFTCLSVQGSGIGIGIEGLRSGIGIYGLCCMVYVFKIRVSGFGVGRSGSGVNHFPARHVPDLDEVAPGLRIRVQGFGFRVSGSRF